MANLFSPVRPGDLITADFMNKILAEIQSLEDRISQLSSTGTGPVILTLSPSGVVHIGDTLTVFGANFTPLTSLVATINEAVISPQQFLPGTDSSHLIFVVPTVSGISDPNGQPVTLSVSTVQGSQTYRFNLAPAPITIPTGQIFVNLTGISPSGNITANQYTLTFTFTGGASMDEDYNLIPTLSAPAAENWPAPSLPGSVHIAKGVPPNYGSNSVTVQLTVPAGASSGQLRLAAVSKLNPSGLLSSSGNLTFKVGSAAPLNPAGLAFSVTGIAGGTQQNDGSAAIPTTGTEAEISLMVLGQTAGIYSAALASPGGNWNARLRMQTPQFQIANANGTAILPVRVSATSGAAATSLPITITGPDGQTKWVYVIALVPGT